ncbi:MAG: CPBP family intramembrane metalloprotease [Deltaproteobacteria bacterium]|nr:CPBP family intramembrane metalloprotease [Deltaproteobacteria bacterium]
MSSSMSTVEAVEVAPLPPIAAPLRRVLEVFGFWAIWVALGFALHLGGEAYLLAGVPLTIAFQLLVRRRPLGELWIRGGPLRFDAMSLGLGVGFAVLPMLAIVKALRGHAWLGAAWGVCALIGAFGAGVAFRRLGKWGWKQLALCLLVGGSLGSVTMLGSALVRHFMLHLPFQFGLRAFGGSLLLYVAVCFVLEEVSFRGAVDAHLNPPGHWKFGYAVIASALWGLWHLPLVLAMPLPTPMPLVTRVIATSISLAVVHMLLGVPLSYFYGRTGNLAVSSTTHAFVDAIRNALGMMPT